MAFSDEIKPGMQVRNARGDTIGVIDRIEGDRIKLTASDSTDGQHHYVARSDVSRVDEHVHVNTAGRLTPAPKRKRRGLLGWLFLLGLIVLLAFWIAGSFDNIDDGARGITDTGQFSEGGNTAK